MEHALFLFSSNYEAKYVEDKNVLDVKHMVLLMFRAGWSAVEPLCLYLGGGSPTPSPPGREKTTAGRQQGVIGYIKAHCVLWPVSVSQNQRTYVHWERTAPPVVLNWDAFLCSVCCITALYLSVCITADRAEDDGGCCPFCKDINSLGNKHLMKRRWCRIFLSGIVHNNGKAYTVLHMCTTYVLCSVVVKLNSSRQGFRSDL